MADVIKFPKARKSKERRFIRWFTYEMDVALLFELHNELNRRFGPDRIWLVKSETPPRNVRRKGGIRHVKPKRKSGAR